MKTEKKDFDREASFWDKGPGRGKLASDVASAIVDEVMLSTRMDVLDFGCGTGLLTLHLQPLVHSVTGVDSSHGMLAVLKAKIADQNLTNATTSYLDIEKGDVLKGSYHLVVSSMTLHHIRAIKPLFDQFYKITAPAGYLCIADLDPDNGKFHDRNDGVFHFGFDRARLREAFTEAGFDDIRDRTAAKIVRPITDGDKRAFTVFLMTGRKRP